MRYLLAGLLGLSLSGAALAQIPEPMLSALRDADVGALERVLAEGANPNARGEQGLRATALMYAASSPDPALVEALLAAGADIDTPDAMGDPALNWAAYYGHARVVARLLDAGAGFTATGHGDAEQIVMRRGHEAALAVILDHGARLPQRTGAEAALEAAASAGDKSAISELADILPVAEARDWAVRPVLQAAARADSAVGIAALLEAGAPVDAADSIGFTALFEAARDGAVEAVRALIENGADVNRVSAPSGMSLTPVHMAAIGGHADIISILVAAGADPDIRGSTGATPMLWAAFEDRPEAVLALLEAGADPSLTLEDGTSVRGVAERQGWSEVVARIDAREP